MQLLQSESGGITVLSYEAPAGALPPYVEERLRLGVCSGVLSPVITGEGDRIRLGFSAEESEPLDAYVRKNRGRWENQGDRILSFGRAAVRALLDAELHFLPLSLFVIDCDHVRIRRTDASVALLPDCSRAERTAPRESDLRSGAEGIPAPHAATDDVPRLREELASFLDTIGSGLADSAWNAYRERLLIEIREDRGGLRSLVSQLERAEGELVRWAPDNEKPAPKSGFPRIHND